jgi:hypothetical protein
VKEAGRYARIIEALFLEKHTAGAREVPFRREDIQRTAHRVGLARPQNLGDVIYSMRYRASPPKQSHARNLKEKSGLSKARAGRTMPFGW